MRRYDAYIFDLDGTVFLGDALLPTAGETIAALRGRGLPVVFLSNNPTRTRAEYVAKLTRLGLDVTPDDIIHSSLVMANFLRRRMPGARLFVVGEEPLKTELQAAGFKLTEDPRRVDAVIASFDRTFAYRKLQIAFDAIRSRRALLCHQRRPLLPGAGRRRAGCSGHDRSDRGVHRHEGRGGGRQAIAVYH